MFHRRRSGGAIGGETGIHPEAGSVRGAAVRACATILGAAAGFAWIYSLTAISALEGVIAAASRRSRSK